MKRAIWTGLAGLAVVSVGCRDTTPPPPRATLPPPGVVTEVRGEYVKPLPEQGGRYQPPFEDAPLVTQEPPEQLAFAHTYEQVGSPRIAVFVNRTLEGQIASEPARRLVAGAEVTRESTGPVTIERTRERVDPWGRPIDQSTDRFETTGPARVTDRAEIYLAPGEYDEVAAKRIDYDAVENIMQDWIASGGRVTVVSPKLTEAQVRELQQGQRNALQQLSRENVDVLIQVQAKPTRQTQHGLEVRLIAEAINTAGGESIGRAVVDLPPPLDKPAINEYTRFLARKLMSDMTNTWSRPAPARSATPREPVSPQPPVQPPTTSPTTRP